LVTTKTEIDFNALFEFWIFTGLHITDFIVGLDFPGDLTDLINDWPKKLKAKIKNTVEPPKEWRSTLKAKPTGNVQPGDINLFTFQREIKTVEPLDIIELSEIEETPLPMKREQIQAKIINWRESQALSDWTLAEKLRDKIKNLCDGEHCYLGADYIKKLSAALVDLQKVQRLALGLSSENIGFPLKGVSQGGEQLPVCNLVIEADAKKVKKSESR